MVTLHLQGMHVCTKHGNHWCEQEVDDCSQMYLMDDFVRGVARKEAQPLMMQGMFMQLVQQHVQGYPFNIDCILANSCLRESKPQLGTKDKPLGDSTKQGSEVSCYLSGSLYGKVSGIT